MSFLLGLLVGSMLSGPDGRPVLSPSSLGSIPFRCLAAIEQSDDAYKACRRLSLGVEITLQMKQDDATTSYSRADIRAAIDAALAFEIQALRELEQAAKQKQDKQ